MTVATKDVLSCVCGRRMVRHKEVAPTSGTGSDVRTPRDLQVYFVCTSCGRDTRDTPLVT